MPPSRNRTRSTTYGRWLLALSAVCLFASATLVGTAGSQTVPPRTATITPNSDLGLQVVTVAWAGFRKTKVATTAHRVVLLQCKAGAVLLGDCYLQSRVAGSPVGNEVGYTEPTIVYGQTSIEGTGSTLFEVRPGRNLPELNCGAEQACELVVLDRTDLGAGFTPSTPLPAGRAIVPLDFAPQPASCVSATPDVRVIGEESARHGLYEWAVQTCLGDEDLLVDYTQSSGPGGQKSFFDASADIGVTSQPVPTADIAGARTFAYAPLDATATVVVFRAFDNVTGTPIERMNLSPRLVARLISSSANYNSVPKGPGSYFGNENIFHDPEFRALNPGTTHWPTFGAWTPYVRSERHDDAQLLTAWMANDTDARAFLSGQDRCGRPMNDFWAADASVPVAAAIDSYPTDKFDNRSANPSATGFRPVQGTETMTRRLFNGIVNAGAVDFVTGVVSDVTVNWEEGSYASFGVTDLGTALAYRLPIAGLVPARTGTTPTITACGPVPGVDLAQTATRTGDPLANPVAVTEATLDSAYDKLLADPGKGPAAAFAAATSVAGAYPLARVDYGLVPTKGLTAKKTTDVAAFLDYVADGGQDDLPLGLPVLPDRFVTQTKAAAAAVRAQTGSTPNPPPEPPAVTPPVTPFDPGTFNSDTGFQAAPTVGSPVTDQTRPTTAPDDEIVGAAILPVTFASVTPGGGKGSLLLPALLVVAFLAMAAGLILVDAPAKVMRRLGRSRGQGAGPTADPA